MRLLRRSKPAPAVPPAAAAAATVPGPGPGAAAGALQLSFEPDPIHLERAAAPAGPPPTGRRTSRAERQHQRQQDQQDQQQQQQQYHQLQQLQQLQQHQREQRQQRQQQRHQHRGQEQHHQAPPLPIWHADGPGQAQHQANAQGALVSQGPISTPVAQNPHRQQVPNEEPYPRFPEYSSTQRPGQVPVQQQASSLPAAQRRQQRHITGSTQLPLQQSAKQRRNADYVVQDSPRMPNPTQQLAHDVRAELMTDPTAQGLSSEAHPTQSPARLLARPSFEFSGQQPSQASFEHVDHHNDDNLDSNSARHPARLLAENVASRVPLEPSVDPQSTRARHVVQQPVSYPVQRAPERNLQHPASYSVQSDQDQHAASNLPSTSHQKVVQIADRHPTLHPDQSQPQRAVRGSPFHRERISGQDHGQPIDSASASGTGPLSPPSVAFHGTSVYQVPASDQITEKPAARHPTIVAAESQFNIQNFSGATLSQALEHSTMATAGYPAQSPVPGLVAPTSAPRSSDRSAKRRPMIPTESPAARANSSPPSTASAGASLPLPEHETLSGSDEFDTALARIAFRAIGARDADKLRALADEVPREELPDRVVAAAKVFAHALFVAIDASADVAALQARSAAMHRVLAPDVSAVEGTGTRVRGQRARGQRIRADRPAVNAGSGTAPLQAAAQFADNQEEESQIVVTQGQRRASAAAAPTAIRRESTAAPGTATLARRRQSTFLRRKRDKALPSDYHFSNKPSTGLRDSLVDAVQESMRELQLVASAFADVTVIRRNAISEVCTEIIRQAVEPLTKIEKRFSQGILEAVDRARSVAVRAANLANERTRQASSPDFQVAATELDVLASNTLKLTEKLAIAATEALFESQQALQILSARVSRGSFAAVIASGRTSGRLDTRPFMPQKNLKAYRVSAMLNKIDCRSAELQGIVGTYREDISLVVEAAHSRSWTPPSAVPNSAEGDRWSIRKRR